MAALAARGGAVRDSEEVEVLACRKALEFAIDAGFTEIVLEGDNALVMKMITQAQPDLSRLGLIYEDIWCLAAGFRSISYNCIRRSANGVADSLARFARLLDNEIVWLEEDPPPAKYFVDKVLNKNCFVLFARELHIEWSDHQEYWQWNQDKDISGEDIEVAELLHVTWLEVRGTIWTVDLSPETLYEIVFVVKIIGGSISQFSMKLTMTYPNNESKKHHESLEEKPFDEWIEIWVGDFIMSPEIVGNLNFSLDATDQMSKDGLVVKCAIIRPKN
ncbi:uncharacterized protein PHLOEM PROTEIN 2-LIKE A4-like [Quercus lobata]|uniref:uncharacterized protein PHLOEM PROTEIN 2-LIKE A4-like n=1 Tax=Quercus lobata TaxID=97700 RepID=UPI001249025E|nr:uncharacterized protein PHLOEM PROTEIN 2-LIKE A4-like [Quercus lobata]